MDWKILIGGGDSLELTARIEERPKREIMSDLAKQLLQEARAALENAARNNDALPQWVQEIITPAGWSHYRKLQGQEHSGG